jgi:hypothetical protein
VTLADARGAYEVLSGKVSDIVRQMSLAGVGLVWIFKGGTAAQFFLDPVLFKAALFIFLALLLDFLQYFFGTVIWYVYFRYKETHGTTATDDFLAPVQLNWPMWLFFYLKAAAMLVAYVCYIIPFLFSKFGL